MITMDADRRILTDGAVAISGERIVAVGSTDDLRTRYPAHKVVAAGHKVILPGMVDLHAHLGGGLLKTIGSHLNGFRWRTLLDFVCSRVTTPEWWRVEALINALEHIKFGTTAIFTMLGGNGTRTDDPTYTAAAAAALEQIGIRARIGLGPARPPWPREFSYWQGGQRIDRQVTFDEVIATCDRLLAAAQARPSRTIDYCMALSRLGNPNPHDPMWNLERGKWVVRQAEAVRDLMHKYHVGFWTHAYGNAIEYAYEHHPDLLTTRTIVSHCTDIDARSIAILKETGSSVAHHPRARRIYSFPGRCPVPELIDAGVTVALGSDGPPPDRTTDIFLDMKAATLLQRLHFRDQGMLPAGKVLEMATIDGYKALNLDDALGSIEAGKRADLITIDVFQPHLVPFNMPVHRVVYEATGHDVRDVIVNGRLLMEDRKVLVVDEAAVMEEAQQMLHRTVDLAGLEPFMQLPRRFWRYAHE